MPEPPCQIAPSTLLVNNYHACLRWRLEVWFSGRAALAPLQGTLRFQARLEDLEATLEFFPERCCWRVEGPAEPMEGSFDRVSKRLRQYFSRITPKPRRAVASDPEQTGS